MKSYKEETRGLHRRKQSPCQLPICHSSLLRIETVCIEALRYNQRGIGCCRVGFRLAEESSQHIRFTIRGLGSERTHIGGQDV